MAEFETVEIPSGVVRLALNEVAEKTLKLKTDQLFVSLASKSGANNFIGIVYRATFNKDDEKNPLQTLIVKVAPQQLERRQRFQIRPLFLREIFMYDQVSATRQIENLPFGCNNGVCKITGFAILPAI